MTDAAHDSAMGAIAKAVANPAEPAGAFRRAGVATNTSVIAKPVDPREDRTAGHRRGI